MGEGPADKMEKRVTQPSGGTRGGKAQGWWGSTTEHPRGPALPLPTDSHASRCFQRTQSTALSGCFPISKTFHGSGPWEESHKPQFGIWSSPGSGLSLPFYDTFPQSSSNPETCSVPLGLIDPGWFPLLECPSSSREPSKKLHLLE